MGTGGHDRINRESWGVTALDSFLIVVSRELDRVSALFISTTYTLCAWSVHHMTK